MGALNSKEVTVGKVFFPVYRDQSFFWQVAVSPVDGEQAAESRQMVRASLSWNLHLLSTSAQLFQTFVIGLFS